MTRGDGAQPLLEVTPDAADLREQSGGELVQHTQRGAAGEEIAAVGRAVIAERNGPGHRLRYQRRADRESAAQCFANRNEMRFQTERGKIERASGPAHAAL